MSAVVLNTCPVINDEIKVRWKNNECVVGDPDYRHCTYAGSFAAPDRIH
ncbi:Hypothetical protein c0497 [Escherichia coli CFT073]|uniref:Uncharacterized protein n=1 Tax=Escherichia coli O6:H1 (strain CFT073 / ATCC 700928 / UPEC) TaxID=199310 RepID=A0A0H2V5F6_ECOL6|nr:Hypothetical protein c0497 [Escherichia coli CFT073]